MTDLLPGAFHFSRTPSIYFGEGVFETVPLRAAAFGTRALLVSGASSLAASGFHDRLMNGMTAAGLKVSAETVSGEPSPEVIDDAVGRHADAGIDVVVAAGGGSVIDAAKAIAAMIPLREEVGDYLENAGTLSHPGLTLPVIAVPTTSGTGSEATKNAVLSRVGVGGFKCSLRHDNFVPAAAVIDPALMVSCPPRVTAACGMDALAQLLESYLSGKAQPLTDSLALPAIALVLGNLEKACTTGSRDIAVRGAMAYGALVSGITLANAGLGIIHGLASVLGGRYPVPHGAACAAVLPPALKATVRKATADGNKVLLEKLASAGSCLDPSARNSTARACNALVSGLYGLAARLELPGLDTFGVDETELDSLAARASHKDYPVRFSASEIREILSESL